LTLPDVVPLIAVTAVTVAVVAAATESTVVSIVHSAAIPLVTHHRVVAHHVAA
jgi:hypothetical protein